jgi:putative membrane protein
MKSRTAFVSKVVIATTVTFVAVGAAFAQVGGNPYDTDASNPFLRKNAPSADPSASATVAATKALSTQDNKFLVGAVSSGAWEVKTGTSVENKLQSAAAKNVATRLVSDNTRTNNELVALAKKKGLALAPENIKGQQVPGPNVDKNYLTLVEQDHRESIPLFQKEASSGNDPEIKAYAAKALPTLREHAALVKEAASKAK